MSEQALNYPLIQLLGAGCFGVIIGWYVYYINRYRKGDVQLSDIVTLLGILGGASVQALYKGGGVLFGAYSMGLCIGFFGYFFVLIILVRKSPNFTADWFLDGRRKKPQHDEEIPGTSQPTVTPMAAKSQGPAGA
jgi:hypothetical protein